MLSRFISKQLRSCATKRATSPITRQIANLSVCESGRNNYQNASQFKFNGIIGLVLAGTVCFSNFESSADSEKPLPVYRRQEVAKHTNAKSGIWVTFKDGVYDVTEFVANHPGILL